MHKKYKNQVCHTYVNPQEDLKKTTKGLCILHLDPLIAVQEKKRVKNHTQFNKKKLTIHIRAIDPTIFSQHFAVQNILT